MKNVIFALAFMLTTTLAFATTANKVKTVNAEAAVELVKTSELDTAATQITLEFSEEFGICVYTVIFLDLDGNMKIVRVVIPNINTQEECEKYLESLEVDRI